VASTFANGVSLCRFLFPAPMMCHTSMPRAVSASAMSERWQRHGTASAHMIAVREGIANNASIARSNSAVCM
jgi:hypothetical protein